MRKLALAVPFLLVLAACGADSKSCSTAAAQLDTLATSCTLAPGTTVSLRASAHCDSCAHTSPSCVGENVGGTIELNPVFQECTEDRGCTGGCSFGALSCTFTTPSASGPINVTIVYPSNASGGLSTTTVTVAPGGGTNCSALASEATPAP